MIPDHELLNRCFEDNSMLYKSSSDPLCIYCLHSSAHSHYIFSTVASLFFKSSLKMIFSTALLGLVLTSFACAAPTTVETTTFDLNSTKWTPDHVLKHDEVILYGENGRSKLIFPVFSSPLLLSL